MICLNKKGSVQDITLIIAALFFMAIVILVGFKVFDAIKTGFNENDATQNNAELNASMSHIRGMFPGVIDSTIMLVLVILLVAAIAFALLTRFHPIFFIFFIIIFAILLQVSAVISDAYQEFAENSEFAALEGELTFTHLIMRNLPWIIGFAGCLLAWVMYKIWQAEDVGVGY